MAVLRVESLPVGALEAAAVFHAEWLGRAMVLLNPPRSGEDLVLVFQPADHTHRAWRLAVIQSLAREYTPLRVNALVSDDPSAIAAALAHLEGAPGLTGQYLALDGVGAGDVIRSAK